MSTINLKKNIWAYGIIASFALFMSLMIGFAVVASHHKVNLVVTDYYKAEIEYQQQIDKEANTKALALKPAFNYNTQNKQLEVKFPEYISKEGVNGTLHFYKPDAPDMDFEIALAPDAGGSQLIAVNDKQSGFWRVKMNWQTNGISYYIEDALTLK